MQVGHGDRRGGPRAYLVALDLRRVKVFGCREATTGMAPFGRLVDRVMGQPPYNEARRVLRVMENGSSHRGESSIRCRLTRTYPRPVPVHGSGFYQIELYQKPQCPACRQRFRG